MLKLDTQLPQQQENSVPIVFVADKEYLPFFAVVLESIMVHARDENFYHIIFFDTGNTDSEILGDINRQCQKKKNFSFHYKSIANLIDNHREILSRSLYKKFHYTLATFGRLFIPEILKDFDKVIYADVDIIFQRDIAELMTVDLDDHLIAAAPDTLSCCGDMQTAHDRMKSFGVPYDEGQCYVNAGLLVFNIAMCRQHSVLQNCLALLTKYTLKYADQDALNAICLGKIYYLEQAWNCQVSTQNIIITFLQRKKMTLEEYIDRYDNKTRPVVKEYFEAYDSPVTNFHYISSEKPWLSIKSPKAEIFWRYCQSLPSYTALLMQMNFHLFDGFWGFSGGPKQTFQFKFLGIPIGHLTGTAYKIKYYLGFVPLVKIKQKKGRKRFYILGLPLISITRKTNQ